MLRDSVILILRARQKSVADHEYARPNTGASITRASSGSGVLPTCELEQGENNETKSRHALKHDGLIAKLVGEIDLNRPGGSVNRRYLLLIVEDRLRNRFAHFKLGAHFLDLRRTELRARLLLTSGTLRNSF